MLLAIDIGNTNTVFALFDGEKLLDHFRLQTEKSRTGDAYATFLADCLEMLKLGFGDIDAVLVSSVVPEANFPVTYFAEKYIQSAPHFLDHQSLDMTINLDNPEEVGADRLVNALAVCAEYDTPAIVIDFGTATTFDVISAPGTYDGGVIAPGINLSLTALEQAASKLPHITIEKPKSVIAKSTKDAMKSGVYWGYVGLIRGLLGKIQENLPKKAKIIATGGLARLFEADIPEIDVIDNNLTLKGLYLAYKKVKNG